MTNLPHGVLLHGQDVLIICHPRRVDSRRGSWDVLPSWLVVSSTRSRNPRAPTTVDYMDVYQRAEPSVDPDVVEYRRRRSPRYEWNSFLSWICWTKTCHVMMLPSPVCRREYSLSGWTTDIIDHHVLRGSSADAGAAQALEFEYTTLSPSL